MESNDDRSDKIPIPRLVPDEPFPSYSYVTGRFPHPTRDPAGHSYGIVPAPCPVPHPESWRDCRPYLIGLDLFNHGYYWEAHEVWEGLWHAAGRTGLTANFMQALIKLAAAGVKAREGRPEGVRRHSRRAVELFQQLARQLPADQSSYFGLLLPQLVAFATDAADRSSVPIPLTGPPVEIVFPFVLRPE